jgi:hypothetical protein
LERQSTCADTFTSLWWPKKATAEEEEQKTKDKRKKIKVE